MPEHSFFVEDIGVFTNHLESRDYTHSESSGWITYSRNFSKTLIKNYSYRTDEVHTVPVRILVTYQLEDEGRSLQKITQQLKKLNFRYRQSLPGWKTKKASSQKIREGRWMELEKFLFVHRELISCFKYESDDRLTEGNISFNLQVASTTREQKTCLEFIKALAEAHAPRGLIRARREVDKPVQQRNGWIKRYSLMYKKKGWSPLEIAREIQKELRNGTWNERSRLQYNIANSTICKIAGIKIPHHLPH